ncbi:MAG: DolP-mannose mannosyltransferase [Candidatus Binatia bacterium]
MKLLVALALTALAVAMCVGHGVATRPIRGDNQLYFFQTERCASGVPPHVAHLEVKTQLPTMIGAAALVVGRQFSVHDVTSGRIACVAAAAVAVVLGWLLVLELTGSMAASLVGGAAMLSIFGLFMEAASGFQPKVFLLPFLLGAHLACAQRKDAVTGAAGAAAFLCWQPAGLVLASCGLATLLDRQVTWKRLLKMVVGAAVVFGAYEAWFAWNGALAQQLDQEWVLAFGAPHKPTVWAEAAWFVLTEAQAQLQRPNGLPSVFVAASALLWLGILFSPQRALAVLRERPGLVAFWLAAHLTTLFTLYDHQAHPDMLLVQPYFAAACGIASGWLFRVLVKAPGGRHLALAATTGFVILGLLDARSDVARSITRSYDLEHQFTQGRLASLYQDHRLSIWAVGSVHLLALNRLDNWVPVGNVGHETSRLDMKNYRPLRDGVMPEIILAGRGLKPGIGSWLTKEYVEITPAIYAADRIRVYSRRRGELPGFEKTTAPKAVALPRNPGASAPKPRG